MSRFDDLWKCVVDELVSDEIHARGMSTDSVATHLARTARLRLVLLARIEDELQSMMASCLESLVTSRLVDIAEDDFVSIVMDSDLDGIDPILLGESFEQERVAE
ncbi:MAG: hypothetical protein CMJ33_00115 [Phycisphaerae bacterium]|nr:hypothetical protein [Phycisphaerae bacterium]|tara:strand:+ start:1257 stop:1571 length:315 start_codon:yes stop_codon:yes gene_type:complete